MRIGVDARPLTLTSTGITRYTAEILSRLATGPHQLYLYSDKALVHPIVAQLDPQVRYVASSLPRSGSLVAQLCFPRWASRDKLDVFWSPRHHLPLAMSTPAVVTIHDTVWRKAPRSMRPLGRLLERVLMPPSLRKAAAVIAVSGATRDDIVELMPDVAGRTTVIAEAAFAHAPGCSPLRSEVILFVGTFEPRKNLERLLQGFALATRRLDRSYRLVLAGREGWNLDLKRIIARLGLQTRTEVITPEDQAELERLYAGCDFLVLPSIYEGFGLPILEALSFGKPVITSQLSSMPEVAGDAALLVDPYSVEDIAEAICRLGSDEQLYHKLAARARPQAAKFSWDQAAADTLKVLESVAARAGSRH